MRHVEVLYEVVDEDLDVSTDMSCDGSREVRFTC
jgi:hypothetical protein